MPESYSDDDDEIESKNSKVYRATYEGSEETHADAYVDDSERVDEEFTTSLEYRQLDKEETYGLIGGRGEDLEISRPVDDVAELSNERHLEAQFHVYNRDQWDENSPYPNDGTTLFHLKLVQLAPEFLEEEGVGSDAPGKYRFMMKYMLMMSVHGYSFDKPKRFTNFRDDVLADFDSVVLDELGLENPTEELPGETFIKLKSDISTEDEKRAIRAAIRAVFGLYRRGIVLPQDVKERYDLVEVEPPLYEDSDKFPRDIEKHASRSWIQFLIEEIENILTFGRQRTDNTPYDSTQYLGLLATSALTGVGVEAAPKLLDWHYDEQHIPPTSDITMRIKNRLQVSQQSGLHDYGETEFPPIDDIFDEIHQNTFSLARKYNIEKSAEKLALDKFTIEWRGDKSATVSEDSDEESNNSSEWTFLLLTIVGPKSRFIIGTRLIRDEANSERATRELLRLLPDDFDIDFLLADAGEISGELLEVFKSLVGPNWLTMAPNTDEIKELIWATPSNAVGYTDSVEYNRDPSPKAEVYPYKRFLKKESKDTDGDDKPKYKKPVERIKIPSNELQHEDDYLHKRNTRENESLEKYSGEYEQDSHPLADYAYEHSKQENPPHIGRGGTHKSFFMDHDIEARSIQAHNFLYKQRWGIETTIRELKHRFRPYTQSSSPEVQLFFINIGILFHNWHTIINRAPDPETNLRLNVNYAEVLRSIEDVAFAPDKQSSSIYS